MATKDVHGRARVAALIVLSVVFHDIFPVTKGAVNYNTSTVERKSEYDNYVLAILNTELIINDTLRNSASILSCARHCSLYDSCVR